MNESHDKAVKITRFIMKSQERKVASIQSYNDPLSHAISIIVIFGIEVVALHSVMYFQRTS